MSDQLALLVIALLAYLIGSISSAIIVCYCMRLPNPSKHGSKNPGATNVLRLGGKGAALITLIADAAKGLIPVLLVRYYQYNDTLIAIAGFSAVVGHIFPIFFGFKGGKGIATSLGAMLAMSPLLACIIVAIWLTIFALYRYSSLAAITAILLGLVYGWGVLPQSQYVIWVFIAAILLWRHKSNIIKLCQGKEFRFGHKPS